MTPEIDPKDMPPSIRILVTAPLSPRETELAHIPYPLSESRTGDPEADALLNLGRTRLKKATITTSRPNSVYARLYLAGREYGK